MLTELTISIFILCFFIVLIINYVMKMNVEKFEGNRYLISDNILNVEKSLNIDSVIYQKVIESIKYNGTIDKNILGVDNNKIELYIDPYVFQYVLKANFKNISIYNDGIFVCLSYKELNTNDCIWNLENKVVAYVYISDFLFIQALIKSYRLDINKISLKKINLDDFRSENKLFDYCITYIVIESKYMQFISKSLYYINGFKDVDINRLKVFYPFIKENYNNMRYYFNDKMIKNYVNDNNVLIPIMNTIIVNDVNDITEAFITRLSIPDNYISSGYGCYGNAKISDNKNECNSLYNIDGTPKTYYSIWDKKCSVDKECPYYKANKNYPNKRGGCIDGFCEFPIGVKRLGFKKFDDTGLNSPLCYDCDDTNDINCCKRIENESGKNADYVFGNDLEDRTKYNLKTIISQLDYRMYK